ncbi:hypothetical protein [Ligilactobacillus sp. Marseille-Q7487]|jgi:hypothetical protein|uniref:hypothetical protein n=1 Tax=Ligilactobacillus sp. Marseille-Q7487 TaxID=3022128 RepID=UPI0015B55009|nr:hypothetical protein [Ligilactobacillus sp. Marseille-Q7487]
MTQDYQELLEKLRTNEIQDLLIKADEFMTFQPYFMNYSHKKNIVGKALRGGDILYHYDDGSQK